MMLLILWLKRCNISEVIFFSSQINTAFLRPFSFSARLDEIEREKIEQICDLEQAHQIEMKKLMQAHADEIIKMKEMQVINLSEITSFPSQNEFLQLEGINTSLTTNVEHLETCEPLVEHAEICEKEEEEEGKLPLFK